MFINSKVQCNSFRFGFFAESGIITHSYAQVRLSEITPGRAQKTTCGVGVYNEGWL